MEGFGMNTAKSLLGTNVNLHLKDGSVIVNVRLLEVQMDEYRRKAVLKYVPYKRKETSKIPLRSIAWAEKLNMSLLSLSR